MAKDKKGSKIHVTNRDPKRLVKEDDDQAADDASKQKEDSSSELEDLKQQLLRVGADFDNFKRRTAEERTEMIDAARAELALQFVPVIDNFDRAAAHVPKEIEQSDWYKGFEGIQKQFDQVLESLGIARIESVGQPFDPNKHEAVAHEPNDDHDKDTISEEFEAGYTLGDSVIRPAKVKVSSGKPEKEKD